MFVDSVLTLCWLWFTSGLPLCWLCVDSVLRTLCWLCAYSCVSSLCWRCFDSVLTLCWLYADSVLTLCSPSVLTRALTVLTLSIDSVQILRVSQYWFCVDFVNTKSTQRVNEESTQRVNTESTQNQHRINTERLSDSLYWFCESLSVLILCWFDSLCWLCVASALTLCLLCVDSICWLCVDSLRWLCAFCWPAHAGDQI